MYCYVLIQKGSHEKTGFKTTQEISHFMYVQRNLKR